MKVNLIYGLRDPRNDLYYYIGKSTVGESRAISHLHYSHNKDVVSWVEELKTIGLEPFVDIIEENIAIEILAERESYWIKQAKAINPELLNIQLNQEDRRIESFNYVTDDKIEMLVELLNNLSILLRGLRIKKRMTQDSLSKGIGISRSTISLLERGGTTTTESAVRVLNYLTETKNAPQAGVRINKVLLRN